ncbi:MAG: hypothetical protein HYX61_02035 [Gammaproteobacteria bacterium]|jgi:hypothetical protein|nr:hypothetical protein [Gammaproteobacteria bacterium]
MKYYVVSNSVAINKVTPETLRDALFANDRFYAFTNKKDAEKLALDGVKANARNQFAVYAVEFNDEVKKGYKATSCKLSTGEVLKKGVVVVNHADAEDFTYTDATLSHVDAKKFKKPIDVAAFEEEASNEEEVEESNEEEAEVSNEEEAEVSNEEEAEEEVKAAASLKDKAKAALNKAKDTASSVANKAKDAATSAANTAKDAANKAKDAATSVANTSTFKYAAGVTTAIAATSAAIAYGNVVPSILGLLAKSATVAPYAAAFAAKVGVAGVAVAAGTVAVASAIAIAAAGYGLFKLAKSVVSKYQQTAKEKHEAKLEKIKELKAKLDKKDRPFVNALDNMLAKAPEAKFKTDGSEAVRQPKGNKALVAAFELDRLEKVVALSGAARAQAEKEILAEAKKTFKA